MNINRNNYEVFFIDYFDGKLSVEQKGELLVFLEQHADLKEEFESFDNGVLSVNDPAVFEDKFSLKKTVPKWSDKDLEEYAVGAVEDTLTSAQKSELDVFLKQYPHLQKELDLFHKTKLVVDNAIIFENKNSLRRGDKKVIGIHPVYYYSAAIAAGVIILFGLFFLFNNNDQQQNPAFVNVKKDQQVEKVDVPEKKEIAVSNEVINVEKKNNSTSSSFGIKTISSGSPIPVLAATKQKPAGDSIQLQYHLPAPGNNVIESVNPIAAIDPQKENPDTVNIASANTEPVVLAQENEPAVEEVEKETNEIAIAQPGTQQQNFWAILHLGVKGLKKLTGKQVELKTQPKQNGEGTVFAFSIGKFEISGTSKK